MATDDDTIKILERLFSKIENREKLHDIHLELTRLSAEQRSTNERLEDICKTTYGNGAPGLVKHVDRLVQDFTDRRWRERALWGVVLTTASGVALLLIKAYLNGG